MIELDRFVDTFTWNLEERNDLETRVRAQLALYELAWATRLASGLQAGSINVEQLSPEMTSRVLEVLSTSNQELLSFALSQWKLLEDPVSSVLMAPGGKFDEDLVKLMSACGDGISVAQWASCVGEKSIELAMDTDRWLKMPADFEVWSGVREARYQLDPQLTFMTLRDDELAPLRFMLQVAFNSSEEHEGGGEPWEFDSLADQIAQAVIVGVGSDATYAETLRATQEFTVLQRLFRIALDGGLGVDFPVERLVALADATAGSVVEIRTLRWTPKEGRLEQLLSYGLSEVLEGISPSDDESHKRLLAKMRSCVAAADQQVAELQNTAEWVELCDFSDSSASVAEACDEDDDNACLLRSGLAIADQVLGASELRVALGVTEDARLLQEGAFDSCAYRAP